MYMYNVHVPGIYHYLSNIPRMEFMSIMCFICIIPCQKFEREIYFIHVQLAEYTGVDPGFQQRLAHCKKWHTQKHMINLCAQRLKRVNMPPLRKETVSWII